jgi:hypothetical protein
MKKTIQLLKQGFESSSGLTLEFRTFYLTFKKEFTKELKTIGATNIVFSRGHFYISGFFTVDGQAYYFNLGDVRGSEYRMPNLMYRTAKDYKDYKGGSNRWVDIAPLMADKMCWYFKVV